MKYEEYIYKMLRQWAGLDEEDKSKDEEFDKMSSYEVLDALLEYEGIIGYTSRIKDWVEDSYHIKLED